MNRQSDRRAFLKAMGHSTAGLALGVLAPGIVFGSLLGAKPTKHASALQGPMPKRPLGKTGFDVSLLALGGEAAIAKQPGRPSSSAERMIARALDLGVNCIDTSPKYGNGLSETHIGEVMKSRRAEVFLATKTGDRSYDGTMRLAEQSFTRLQTDHIDLYQLEDIRSQEELEQVFSRDGAVRAMERLHSEGAVRFLGIAGEYDPDVLMHGIERYPFDAVSIALNAADIHYRPFQTALLQTAVRHEIAIIATRITAMKRLFRNDGLNSMEDAMGYVFSFPVNTAVLNLSHLNELEQSVRITKRFTEVYDHEQLASIEALTEPYKEDANWFKKA